jgi:peptidoglycan/LPS O-acetylase OafA/YrhL
VDVWTAVLLALTYTSNIGRWLFHHSLGVLSQTWSLGMEEQFYLVWPPILALAVRRRLPRRALTISLAALVLASSALGWILYTPSTGNGTPDIYFSPILNIAPLLTGALLAITLRSSPRLAARLHGRWGVAASWLGLAALVGIELGIQSGWQKQPAIFGVVLPFVGLATTLLIAGVVSRMSLVSRALSLPPIAWFGRNGSYSLYLWHVLVIALVAPLIPGFGGKMVAIVAAIGVAIASHYAIEKPFLLLKRRLEPKPLPVLDDAPTQELALTH